jgi:uncharacterized protein (TIGR03067 family)
MPAAAIAGAAARFAAGERSDLVATGVISLAEGVVRTMIIHGRLKLAAALVLATALIGVGSAVGYRTWASDGAEPAAQEAKPGDPPAKAAKSDHDRIQGLWKLTYVEFEGVDQSAAELKTKNRWRITADTITSFTQGKENRGSWRYRLDPAKTPAAIDLTVVGAAKETTFPSVYQLEGDRLTVCLQNFPERGRPKDLISRKGSGVGKFIYVRMKPGEEEELDRVVPPPPDGKTTTDYLWLLKHQGDANAGADIRKLLAQLSESKVPTPDAAGKAAMKRRFAAGLGIDAQERTEVVGLIRVGGPADVGGDGDFIWIVRTSRLTAVTEEVWVIASTGEARVIYPFGGDAKKP